MGGTIYILAETCTTGRYNTMYYTTPTRIFPHDEDLDAGRIIVLQKRQNGILSIASNNIILCFIWFINFQLQ
jgi:hypothetical protein